MTINLEDYFGDYNKSNIDKIKDYLSILDQKVSKFYNFGKPFFKGNHELNYMEYLEKCNLNYDSLSPDETFEYISPLYQNLPNWGNPGTMINVIPPVNLVSMASMSFTQVFNPNFAQDTYSGLLIASELEVSKYISDLLGWDWKQSHGTFTFGGKGTNLYATKIALTKASPESQINGCEKNKYFMITSRLGHPCHYEVCNWLGIGKDNCFEVECNQDGTINLQNAEKIIIQNIEKGKIFLGFNLNGGSTNEFCIDPIKDIYDLNLKVIHKYNLNYFPHIHVDSVLGWIYLFFNSYDYEKNIFNIEKKTLDKIKSLNKKVRDFKYADSIGVDFHKTGFCPYVSSLFLVKNREDFNLLNPNKKIDLENLQYGEYNPYETTLELTRPSSGPIVALTTLKSLGIKGFQEIISNMFLAAESFRKELLKNSKICVLNKDTEWLTTLFILKPKRYRKLTLEDILNLCDEEIERIREYNINYAKFILEKGKNNEISFTYTSSRSYKVPNTDIKIGAIKAYPMSVFFSEDKIKNLICEILNSIEEYENSLGITDYSKLSSISDNMVYRSNK